MPEFNPYQPPKAQPEPASRTGPGPLAIVVRLLAVVAGFTLLADPFPETVVDRRFRVGAKILGGLLILIAFVPWGRRGRTEVGAGIVAEEL